MGKAIVHALRLGGMMVVGLAGGPLARLCNHLWLVSVPGCVPWQGGATG